MNSITKWSKRLVLAGLLLPGFFSADAQDKITIRGFH